MSSLRFDRGEFVHAGRVRIIYEQIMVLGMTEALLRRVSPPDRDLDEGHFPLPAPQTFPIFGRRVFAASPDHGDDFHRKHVLQAVAPRFAAGGGKRRDVALVGVQLDPFPVPDEAKPRSRADFRQAVMDAVARIAPACVIEKKLI